MSSDSSYSLDIYKVPRESVDVEALAQELVRYLKVAGEDTEHLSYHATRRDELVAELYARSEVKKSASEHVPPGGDPDPYLCAANAAIEGVTPPLTLEDRVARFHFAANAFLVFNEFNVVHALLDYPDLQLRVEARTTQLLGEWLDADFARLFPQSAARISGHPTTSTVLSPVSRRVSNNEVEMFLDSPATLVGKRFVHSPPEGQDQDGVGGWEVVSYVHGYEVVLDASGNDPLPMFDSQVRSLLHDSVLSV
ncbi:hypothetical protein LXA43DRAFT_974615 [Ganoderma leucocontextum]|nr:hypothetical protein LXA43DRAFT_974615 [Ganoderma leucocontextum]